MHGGQIQSRLQWAVMARADGRRAGRVFVGVYATPRCKLGRVGHGTAI